MPTPVKSTPEIDLSQPFEEERLPWYRPDLFYPVRIGETMASRYRVLGKLGYGAHSTSWLCRDGESASFVAVKVCTREEKGRQNQRELRFYEHISSLDSQHTGRFFIRGLFDTFTVHGPLGEHLCLVQQPMHMTIRELQYQNQSRRLTEELLRWTTSNILRALSFLHDEAGVIHTDINPSNIMLTVDDESLFVDYANLEAEEPSPAKVIDDTRTIYGSRNLGLPKDALWGQPVLCDFGEARIGSLHRGLIQPELYRAPEVLFDMSWSSAVDIWNVAVLMWDLLEKRHLFNALDANNETSATNHVAEMVAYMGHPPLEYIRQSDVTKNVFDDQGLWKGAGGVEVPLISLEEAESVLEGDAKERFLDFVRTMLRWVPEERKRATELLTEPWLQQSTPQTT
ncbi:hypothetical protein CERZMDRAFT_121572 [Cercospora zeae-maydis SCOH1-5]|uniref:non-specific serine/threonine protein kinase n=1 Tax=Cercospora zeae-maydis SCOH1-5 TaxID=717836 RepID=A0A6A6FDE0_9PEZI|nr:hypothetical protein CERZMDRAFT_121572 [Cercospora zeae-maydis SCOH1-5]